MTEHAKDLSSLKRPVVFLDRDGTLNKEIGYITNLEDFVLLPGAAKAVARLNQSGVAAIVVTNQSGVARGYYPESHIENLHLRLQQLLKQEDACVDAVYFCPHHKDGVIPEYTKICGCRKPATGMLERSFVDYPFLDRAHAYMVGDQSTDIDLAKNAGIISVLVKTGHGEAVQEGKFQQQVSPDYVADSVVDAITWILKDLGLS